MNPEKIESALYERVPKPLEEGVSFNEILKWARKANVTKSAGTLVRHLRRLERLGFLTHEEVPEYRNLRPTYRYKKTRLGELRQEILRHGGGHGDTALRYELLDVNRFHVALAKIVSKLLTRHFRNIKGIMLYGSVSKGSATVESDVDLLILIEKGDVFEHTAILHEFLYEVESDFRVTFSLNVYDAEEFLFLARNGASFEKSVLEDGVLLYGDLDSWRKK